jgi:putative photosynthetic complex assembly protein 2
MSTVADIGLPVLLVIIVWWSSTGLIFALNRLPQRSYVWSVFGAAVVAALAAMALVATRDGMSRSDAAIAFAAALAIWGLIEMTFLMGFVTGPRNLDDNIVQDAPVWPRFLAASRAIAYHEAALLAALSVVAWLTAGAGNSLGIATFALLWLMRLSTKLNIFFGVPNPASELLPPRIAYLKRHFRRAPMTLMFPISVTIATVTVALLASHASGYPPASAGRTSYTILTTLAALGLLEHWFLVLPYPAQSLWPWGLPVARTLDQSQVQSTRPLDRQKTLSPATI